jgi:hypothetical protein
MNEEYGLKGYVQRLEQRRQSRFDTESLQQTPDHNSFDVEFSLLGQVLQQTNYTYGGSVYGSLRGGRAERVILRVRSEPESDSEGNA